jgi:hypothetical protein
VHSSQSEREPLFLPLLSLARREKREREDETRDEATATRDVVDESKKNFRQHLLSLF